MGRREQRERQMKIGDRKTERQKWNGGLEGRREMDNDDWTSAVHNGTIGWRDSADERGSNEVEGKRKGWERSAADGCTLVPLCRRPRRAETNKPSWHQDPLMTPLLITFSVALFVFSWTGTNLCRRTLGPKSKLRSKVG